MTAGILWDCGAFGGKALKDEEVARRSRFENKEFKEKVLNPYLTLCGADPRGQRPLPELDDLLKLAGLRSKVETMMKFQGYRSGAWFLKANTLALIWPTLKEAFPDAKWIVVRRKSGSIVASCLRTAYMDAYPKATDQTDAWFAWVAFWRLRYEQMKAAGLDVTEVWPAKYIAGDHSEIEKVVRMLKLKWNPGSVEKFAGPTRREDDGE